MARYCLFPMNPLSDRKYMPAQEKKRKVRGQMRQRIPWKERDHSSQNPIQIYRHKKERILGTYIFSMHYTDEAHDYLGFSLHKRASSDKCIGKREQGTADRNFLIRAHNIFMRDFFACARFLSADSQSSSRLKEE